MKYEVPNWLIVLGAIGQMFTAIIYPYIRHVVFDWYNDIKKLKPLNQEIAKTYGRYIPSTRRHEFTRIFCTNYTKFLFA